MRDSPSGLAADQITGRSQARSVPKSLGVDGKQARRWLGGIAFAVLLLAVFTQPLLSLIRYAASSDLNSYTLLIPFVSGYLLYTRRDQRSEEHTSELQSH